MEIPSPIKEEVLLFEAGKLRCPHERRLHDILTYKRFDLIQDFETKLNIVLRCMFCGHIFSPVIQDSEMELVKEAYSAS